MPKKKPMSVKEQRELFIENLAYCKEYFIPENSNDIRDLQFAGIDLSTTSTGITIWDGQYNIKRIVPVSYNNLRIYERVDFIIEKLDWYLDQYYLDFVVLEYYSMDNRSSSLYQLAEFGGMVRKMLYDRNVFFLDVMPTQLKKFATGTGQSSGKSGVLKAVYKKWNIDVDSDDEADATVLCIMARFYADLVSALCKKQLNIKDVQQLEKHTKTLKLSNFPQFFGYEYDVVHSMMINRVQAARKTYGERKDARI